ncbi:MAG TPA: alpha/beta hydrolase [Dehalococcoidia bacterium]|nr:alpha/beta hydrolase [Dehalococcoidia bacterium]
MTARSLAPPPLHVETAGHGPPLLLVPTFACGGEAWGVAFNRALGERFRVLLPDWPDTGRSPPWPDGTVTIAALARAAAALLDSHAPAPAALLGWGLGACVGLELAAERPECVAALVLIGAAASGAELLELAPDAAALCEVAAGASPEEHMLGLLGRSTSPAWRPFAEMFLPQLLPNPARTLAALRAQWRALAGFDARPRLGSIRAPALLLSAELDRVAPPACAAALCERLPNARLLHLPGAGHAAVWEQPGAVLDAIVPFLTGAVQTPDPALNERQPR